MLRQQLLRKINDTKNLQTFVPVKEIIKSALKEPEIFDPADTGMHKILIIKYLEKSLKYFLRQTRASSETLYQNPNLFLNILNQNYLVVRVQQYDRSELL